MNMEATKFYSDRLELDGSFYYPSEGTKADQEVAVVICSGFQGLNNIHPARFSRALTKRGYTCFGFDYRGFAESEGKPGRVLVEEQVRDIVAAVSFVQAKLSKPIVLAGWGMAGGLILEAARLLKGLESLVSINGFYNAKRVQIAVRGEAGWSEFQNWYLNEKKESSFTKTEKLFDPFRIYPLDPVTQGYVDGELRKNKDFGIDVFLEFADSLLCFRPEAHLDEISHLPILIAHGEQNALHPRKEAESLFEQYRGKKEIYWIKEAGHTEWMFDDNPKFKALCDKITSWIEA